MIETIGFLELNSIAKGIEAADAILKAAEVDLIFAKPSLTIFAAASTVRGSVPSASTTCLTSAAAFALILSMTDICKSSLT